MKYYSVIILALVLLVGCESPEGDLLSPMPTTTPTPIGRFVVVTVTPMPEVAPVPDKMNSFFVDVAKFLGIVVFLSIAIPITGFFVMVGMMGSRFLILDFIKTEKRRKK